MSSNSWSLNNAGNLSALQARINGIVPVSSSATVANITALVVVTLGSESVRYLGNIHIFRTAELSIFLHVLTQEFIRMSGLYRIEPDSIVASASGSEWNIRRFFCSVVNYLNTLALIPVQGYRNQSTIVIFLIRAVTLVLASTIFLQSSVAISASFLLQDDEWLDAGNAEQFVVEDECV